VNNKIDWEDLRLGYNRIYHTNYKTPEEMISKMYAADPVLEHIGEVLGVSGQSVGEKMRKEGLPRKPKGHRGQSKYQIAYRKIENPEKLNQKEISEKTGCSLCYAYHLPKIIKKWDGDSKCIF